ncbi:MAG: hypothetical protein P1U56_13755 [Saprospiraceae bacterium]|nr:hypothetical protein [Saprospiraceae bacterium]
MTKKDRIINASVFLFSRGGDSPLESFTPTARNIKKMQPDHASVEKVIGQLKKLGFQINSRGFTISISANQKLFEDIFEIEIHDTQNGIQFKHKNADNATYFNHKSLNSVVAGISLQTDGSVFK